MKQHTILCSMILFVWALGASNPTFSQTSQTVLQQASAAFSQGSQMHGITLNATAEWTAGSDDETGNATLTSTTRRGTS